MFVLMLFMYEQLICYHLQEERDNCESILHLRCCSKCSTSNLLWDKGTISDKSYFSYNILLNIHINTVFPLQKFICYFSDALRLEYKGRGVIIQVSTILSESAIVFQVTMFNVHVYCMLLLL